MGAVAAAGYFDDLEDSAPDSADVVVAVEHDGEVGLILTPIEGEARGGHGVFEEGWSEIGDGVGHAHDGGTVFDGLVDVVIFIDFLPEVIAHDGERRNAAWF